MVNAHAIASVIAKDCHAGAAAAYEMQWASIQIQAMLDNKVKTGSHPLEAADAMEAYKAAWIAHGLPDLQVSPAQIVENQARLQSEGFTAAELAAAQNAGLRTEEIEAARLRMVAADPSANYPSALATFDQIAEAFTRTGRSDSLPTDLWPSDNRQRRACGDTTSVETPPVVPITNNLARVFEITTTMQIADPKSAASHHRSAHVARGSAPWLDCRRRSPGSYSRRRRAGDG